MALSGKSDEYITGQGLSVDDIDVLCEIGDNRAVATASFSQEELEVLLALIGRGLVHTETYANGEHNLLTDKGHTVVSKYNELADEDYQIKLASDAEKAAGRGYRLFGNRIDVSEEEALVELHEITICATPQGLRDLAHHLLEVADEMAGKEPEDFESGWHWHFQPESRPEIVVAGLREEDRALPPIEYDEATQSYRRVSKTG